MSPISQRTGILKLFPETPRTSLESDEGRQKRGQQAPMATPPALLSSVLYKEDK